MKLRLNFDDTFVFVFFFIVSSILMPMYLYGDQVFYRKVYEGFIVNHKSIYSSYSDYKNGLGATELFHFLYIYASSFFGFSKDITMSFANGVLFLFAYKAFKKISGNPYIAFYVTITNFYLYVVAFSAERLKFGFIFIFLYVVYERRYFIYFSVLSHFQILLFVISRYFGCYSKTLLSTKKIILDNVSIILLALLSLSALIFISMTNVISKLIYYHSVNEFGVIGLLKLFTIMFLSIYCTRNEDKVLALSSLLIMCFISMILGTERIIIIMYFITLYFCLSYKNGVNVYILLTGLYFSQSTIKFIYNIVYYNDGFNLL